MTQRTDLPLDIDVADAMTIAVIVTDAFVSLQAQEMPHELKRGVVLLYDAVIRRIEPLLPKTPDMQHLTDAFLAAKNSAALVREVNAMPPVE